MNETKRLRGKGAVIAAGSAALLLSLFATTSEAKTYCYAGNPVADTRYEIRLDVESQCRPQRPGLRRITPVVGVLATRRFTDPYQVGLIHGACSATVDGVEIAVHQVGGSGLTFSIPTLASPIPLGSFGPVEPIDCEATDQLGAP